MMVAQVSRLQADVDALKARLTEIQNETKSTYVTEAVVLEILQAQIQQHLNTAKQDWLKLVYLQLHIHTHILRQSSSNV